MPKGIGCVINTFRPEGAFRLTVQQVADNHDVLINIVYPSTPEPNDLHLVDFEGDDWWILYEFNGSTALVNLVGTDTATCTINLICTNVKTNTLTADPIQVNVIGDLTRNVNFK